MATPLSYKGELEHAAKLLNRYPGHFSIAQIKRMGARSHFEEFDDEIERGTRISLSGSTIVLDIDIVNNKPSDVNLALATAPAADNPHSFLAKVNDPRKLVLESLNEPRLERFQANLDFLSRCDRLSTKTTDCFLALDQMAAALSTKTHGPESPYGCLKINPFYLGAALWYFEADQPHYAYLDVAPGSRKEYALACNHNWFTDGDWNYKPTAESPDVRAELVLNLDPPVVLPMRLADELNAHYTAFHNQQEGPMALFNQQRMPALFEVARHAKFQTKERDHDEFDVVLACAAPHPFVAVKQVPVGDPATIPKLLDLLRQFCRAAALAESVFNGKHIPPTSDVDLSIADVLRLDTAVPASMTSVYVSIIVHMPDPAAYKLRFEVLIPQATTTFVVNLEPGRKPQVEINKPVNQKDLVSLVDAGYLDLALSYIVGSLNVKYRRSSISDSYR